MLAGAYQLLARPSSGAPPTLIAANDVDAGYSIAGASGSQVLFESTAKLACVPAALEGKPNLYTGTGRPASWGSRASSTAKKPPPPAPSPAPMTGSRGDRTRPL